jgi:hypothetical protein
MRKWQRRLTEAKSAWLHGIAVALGSGMVAPGADWRRCLSGRAEQPFAGSTRALRRVVGL